MGVQFIGVGALGAEVPPQDGRGRIPSWYPASHAGQMERAVSQPWGLGRKFAGALAVRLGSGAVPALSDLANHGPAREHLLKNDWPPEKPNW